MTKFLDYMISSLPIRIIELKVDRSKLKIKGLTPLQFGHLPGRTPMRRNSTTESWAFTYIVRGSGTYQIGDGPVQRLEAGSLFWEYPGEVFHFGPDAGKDWDEYYVNFEGPRVAEWLDSLILEPDKVQRVGLDKKWIHKIETIGDYMESGIADNADRASLLLESLVYDFCSANEGRKSGVRPERKPELVMRILEDIGESLYKPWEERDIWERNHISRSTLRRIVHQNTGYALNEYVNRLKISEAKKLLRMTNLQVKQIAQMLGFEDIAYFARLFKKFSGMSAMTFRDKHSDAT
ncbi:helix-turn-helix domain-containing protein [Paenibacillus hemerocallicola]|jgi:AraC-like DNA-binding protein|uniref:Helix-turn-helix domain-containing protein n=1 Tax=Paenibacillus hemerocallicola TaxID=1172614 RepID=A0A5C4TH14_9BACL|nr:helix-turn-helix domain-containing protein [Paenibacillus hemerocallicola]TNJ68373.1 helix-turn-helix domain-containing protein [Paenibacillus hemerocallicola]